MNEYGSIPNIVFDGDDSFGIVGEKLTYTLVERKLSKEKDGTPCYQWTNIAYLSSLKYAIECYMERKEKRLVSKLKKSVGFSEIERIRKEITKIVNDSFKDMGVNKELFDICNLIDKKIAIESDIKELQEKRAEFEKEFEKTMEFIKEKRSIVIKQTESTKHRIKKENGDV